MAGQNEIWGMKIWVNEEKSQARKFKRKCVCEKASHNWNKARKPTNRAEWETGRDLASSVQITKLVPSVCKALYCVRSLGH